MSGQAPLDYDPARDAYRWVDAALADMQHLRTYSIRTSEEKFDFWHKRIMSHMIAGRECLTEVLTDGNSKVY